MRIPYSVGISFDDGPARVDIQIDIDVELECEANLTYGIPELTIFGVYLPSTRTRSFGLGSPPQVRKNVPFNILKTSRHPLLKALGEHVVAEAMADDELLERVCEADPEMYRLGHGKDARWARRPAEVLAL
jgi:hypothetical protein